MAVVKIALQKNEYVKLKSYNKIKRSLHFQLNYISGTPSASMQHTRIHKPTTRPVLVTTKQNNRMKFGDVVKSNFTASQQHLIKYMLDNHLIFPLYLFLQLKLFHN